VACTIMRVGNREPLSQAIKNLGFTEVDTVTILGMEIDYNLECLSTCHNKTIKKIENIGNFWKRFNLTLPGRINIFKTMMLSQISYLGSIIFPSNIQLATMYNIVESFVKKNLNISKERLYQPVNVGGLGLIDIKYFLRAQQVNWIRKANNEAIDNWRFDLRCIFDGNCLVTCAKYVDPERHPVLYGLAISFEKFLGAFNLTNDNYKMAYILNNPVLYRQRGDTAILDKNFFRQVPAVDFSKLCKLRFSDCFVNRNPVQLETVNQTKNLNLNLNTYMRLISALSNFERSLKIHRITDGTFKRIETFFVKPEKGSKHIRDIISKKRYEKTSLDKQTNIKTFFRLTNIQKPCNKVLAKIISLWADYGIPNNLREFNFKFFNNYLAINTRLSHFVADQTRNCTFCTLANTVGEETFPHLFYYCPIVRALQSSFETEFFDNRVTGINSQKFWFTGLIEDDKFNFFNSVCVSSFHCIIWELKLKKKYPHIMD